MDSEKSGPRAQHSTRRVGVNGTNRLLTRAAPERLEACARSLGRPESLVWDSLPATEADEELSHSSLPFSSSRRI